MDPHWLGPWPLVEFWKRKIRSVQIRNLAVSDTRLRLASRFLRLHPWGTVARLRVWSRLREAWRFRDRRKRRILSTWALSYGTEKSSLRTDTGSKRFGSHWSIWISGEIRRMVQSLDAFRAFRENLYGPMALKVRQKFPPRLALVHGWLFFDGSGFIQSWCWDPQVLVTHTLGGI